MQLPKLYSKTSTNKIQTWQIFVSDNAEIITKFGQLNGKIQTKIEKILEGKNLNKSNATTPYEQAILEASSKYQSKLDAKYSITIDSISDILLPMLAHDYRKRSHDISFPCYYQPKLNGVRCLAKKINNITIQFSSRKYKIFPHNIVEHIQKSLLNQMEINEIFDGELYNHNWTFQKILKSVKKYHSYTNQIEYHIFDYADTNLTFESRLNILKSRNINLVPTDTLNHNQVKEKHDELINYGYEGIILRNKNGLYTFDYRSKDLQKYKEFIDDEFLIIDTTYELVEDRKAIIYICQIDNKTFNVRPKGTISERISLYNQRDKLLNSMLTVRYQNLSDDGIPIFPIGVAIRDFY
jgi:DNA ligase 1